MLMMLLIVLLPLLLSCATTINDAVANAVVINVPGAITTNIAIATDIETAIASVVVISFYCR